MAAAPDERIAVGRVGRPHGVRGDVHVHLLSDQPAARFAPGRTLHLGGPARPGRPDTVVLASVSWQGSGLVAGFEGVTDREGALALRGRLLEIEPEEAGEAGPGCWWDHELVGLAVELADSTVVGHIADVLHPAGQDLLAVRRAGGRPDLLVPFVSTVVPVVDVAAGRLVLDPPDGLLEL